MYHTTLRKRIREKGLLHSAMLELTYRCNLDCFFCYNDKDAPGEPLAFEDYVKLFADLARLQVLFLTFTGGEPMTHPRFFDLGKAAREHGFAVRLRTNGHALRPAVAARVQAEIDPVLIEMSLHGACAATHERQTRAPGSFSRLIANIRSMKALGLHMNLVSTLTVWNETELDAMFTLADTLEVRLRFQGPVGPRDNGDLSPMRIQPSAAGWARLQELIAQRASAQSENAPSQTGEDLTARPTPEARPYHCGVGSEEVHIDPFGNVSPCLHLRWPIGNLREQSIAQIWQHSPVLEQARQLAAHTAQRWTGGQKPMQFGAPLFCPGVALKTGVRLAKSSST
ncbi:MAG: radical SAM protein [Candidatus Contendobacter sp.]